MPHSYKLKAPERKSLTEADELAGYAGKSHFALGLGLAACGHSVVVASVDALLEARNEKRQKRIQRQLASRKPLIIDELGYRCNTSVEPRDDDGKGPIC